MRRLAPIALALALAALAAASAAARAPTVIGATAHDDDDPAPGMALTLSRTKVDPGKATIDFFNAGDDVHDLWVKRKGAEDAQGDTGNVGSGEQDQLRAEAPQGLEVRALVRDRRPSRPGHGGDAEGAAGLAAGAQRSRKRLIAAAAAVRALTAPSIAFSPAEPAGGIAPSWRAISVALV